MARRLGTPMIWIAGVGLSLAGLLLGASVVQTGASDTAYDQFGRLAHYSNKNEVACPTQDGRTAVLLLIGQSNAGNHAERKLRSLHEGRIFNFYAGKCYVAASPLLGSTGIAGEPWTGLANRMIEAGAVDRVILVPAAIAGSLMSRWREGGDLNGMLMVVLGEIKRTHRVTHILWHQGEGDFSAGTSTAAYSQMFSSMVASLRRLGVQAPVYASIATRCGRHPPPWKAVNSVSVAQFALSDPGKGVLAGINSDEFSHADRQSDSCHFSARGQERFAEAWMKALRASGAL